jgi:hypothetical protein
VTLYLNSSSKPKLRPDVVEKKKIKIPLIMMLLEY